MSWIIPFSWIAGTALQWDLHQSVVEPDKQRPFTVEDLQAFDCSDLPHREDCELLQVAALEVFVGCGESLEDGAIFWADKMKRDPNNDMLNFIVNELSLVARATELHFVFSSSGPTAHGSSPVPMYMTW